MSASSVDSPKQVNIKQPMCVSVTLLYCDETSKLIHLVLGLRVAVEDGYFVLGGGYDQSVETKISPKNEMKMRLTHINLRSWSSVHMIKTVVFMFMAAVDRMQYSNVTDRIFYAMR